MRLYLESRAPSRYAEGPYQPPPPVSILTATHIKPELYRYHRGAQYPESLIPPSSSPSVEPGEREPPYDDQPYRSRSPEYLVPIGAGPGYDRGAGPTVIQPPPMTHLHQYPSIHILRRSQTSPLPPPTEREGEPLLHHFDPPSQYPPTEQAPMPIGGPPTRPSRAPTIVEVTGPEPIQVYPRKRCMYS
jgi:hypothetical protein